jgi:hypothetical protein
LFSHLHCKQFKDTNIIISPIDFCDHDALSATLREEHILRVTEDKQLRRLGTKWEAVVGGWRRLHNEELHNLYASPNITKVIKSRRTRRTGHVGRIGEVRNAYKICEET